jgi:hypothetical protein
VLFGGSQVIFPQELEEMDTEESEVLEHRKYVQSIRVSRDNIKICKRSAAHGVELVLLGLESQEHIHYAMPLRVMGYDYVLYKKQYESNAGKYRNVKNHGSSGSLTEDEYLSRMRRTDKFVPVITVVVYYGERPWDGATTLRGMLDIPAEMEPFINDYKMRLVEARKNDLTFHNINNRDLFQLIQIILDRSLTRNEAREKAIQYSREHKTDKSVVMAVAGITNTRIDYSAIEEGEGDMCTLFEEIAQESEAKGRAQGRAQGIIETGYDFGLSDSDILERLQTKLNVSLKQAQEYLLMYGRQKD